jgi:multidrug efflux pump subunit AcrB
MAHYPSRRHLWTNLAFALVLALGLAAYLTLPRAQYPEVRLNWVAVATVWPAASARDVERRITLPLEAVVRRAGQVRYVAGTSRDHVSTLLVRFEDIPHAEFEGRLQALTRDIQQAAATLPREARPPQVVELTSSSLFPTAMVLVPSQREDGQGCRLARAVQAELEALPGVDRVWSIGLREPELEVAFDPAALRRHGIAPDALARTLADQAQDVPAGAVRMSGRLYNSRVSGLSAEPLLWAELPIPDGRGGQVPLGQLADIRAWAAPARERVVMADGRPAVLLSVIKRENVNALHLIDAVAGYVGDKNRQLGEATLQLADDQSGTTRAAIRAMENNALLGLLTVLMVAWLFLGRRMALLVSVGVPFALAAMFLSLYLLGETLNTSVLLGVAIVLGIPLDDAVVVAEAIQIRLGQGHDRLEAVRQALREVARPVLASVLATVAAFAPLLMLPGLLGKFMFVVPLTVILTLLASLVASLWILPSHVVAWRGSEVCPRPMRRLRLRLGRGLRRGYGRLLARAFRHPGRVGAVLLVLLGLALAGAALGWLRVQWFASDPLRVFNVNVQLPATADLDATLAVTRTVEQRLRGLAGPGEVRASLSMAGIQFTPSETRHGDHLGQVMISLSDQDGARSVTDFVEAARPVVAAVAGANNIAFQVLSADLPSLSALTVRLTGASGEHLADAAQALHQAMAGIEGIKDAQDDGELGKPQLGLALDSAAAARAGLDPMKVAALIRLHFDGLPVARVADGDDSRSVVLRARDMDDAAVQALLEQPWRLASGQEVKPADLFALEFASAASQSRRVNYRPAVTIQADLDRSRLSAAAAEARVRGLWQSLRAAYPGVAIEFGGELEDVRASLHDLAWLFLLGIVLMYALLAVQFGGLVLPLLMLATAPLALVGVALGLMLSGQPLSLYTLYGCVALGGVAMNAAIVLIAAARDRSEAGMRPLAAAFHAARRRLVPIVITTLSILGGLVSLAFGLGGESLLWGPLAAAMVWGMVVATPLTLFVTPLLYYRLARRRAAPA